MVQYVSLFGLKSILKSGFTADQIDSFFGCWALGLGLERLAEFYRIFSEKYPDTRQSLLTISFKILNEF